MTYCTQNFMQTEPLHVYNIFVSNIFIIILFRDHKYLLFFDITTCVTKGGDLTKYVSIPSCPTPQVLPVDHLYWCSVYTILYPMLYPKKFMYLSPKITLTNTHCTRLRTQNCRWVLVGCKSLGVVFNPYNCLYTVPLKTVAFIALWNQCN